MKKYITAFILPLSPIIYSFIIVLFHILKVVVPYKLWKSLSRRLASLWYNAVVYHLMVNCEMRMKISYSFPNFWIERLSINSNKIDIINSLSFPYSIKNEKEEKTKNESKNNINTEILLYCEKQLKNRKINKVEKHIEFSISNKEKKYHLKYSDDLEKNIIGTIENILEKESCLFICNHLSLADWLFFWLLAYKYNRLKDITIAMKSEMRKIWGIGWAVEWLEYCFLYRINTTQDLKNLRYHIIKEQQENKDSMFFFLFPEGTDFREYKYNEQKQKFPDIIKTWNLKNVLIPRSRGFKTCLETLFLLKRKVYVFDLTIYYGKTICDENRPTFWSSWFGIYPKEIFLDISPFLITKEEILNYELFKSKLLKCFSEKNNYLENNLKKRNNYVKLFPLLSSLKPSLKIYFFSLFWVIFNIIGIFFIIINFYMKIIVLFSCFCLIIFSLNQKIKKILKYEIV